MRVYAYSIVLAIVIATGGAWGQAVQEVHESVMSGLTPDPAARDILVRQLFWRAFPPYLALALGLAFFFSYLWRRFFQAADRGAEP
jgi:hypothetical protein